MMIFGKVNDKIGAKCAPTSYSLSWRSICKPCDQIEYLNNILIEIFKKLN
jgi:hypothetical protein